MSKWKKAFARPPPFPASCGLTLIVQARFTYRILSVALPSGDALRFSHACIPRFPTLIALAPNLAAGLATMQVSSGLILMCTTSGPAQRIAALVGCAAIVCMLLLEASVYQNHLYLMANVLLCLAAIPHGWTRLGLLRFSTALPYVFGALSKLTSTDWMLRHQPTRRWCEAELYLPTAWTSSPRYAPSCAALLSIGGVLIDTCVVPLMALPLLLPPSTPPARAALASRCRAVGAALATAFHFSNHMLFHIGIFPWLMIAALPLWWVEPEAEARDQVTNVVAGTSGAVAPIVRSSHDERAAPPPDSATSQRQGLRRRLTGQVATPSSRVPRRSHSPSRRSPWPSPPPRPSPPRPKSKPPDTSRTPRSAQLFTLLYVTVHVLLPLRRFVYTPRGDPTWSQEGYLGAWLMKRHQTDGLAIVILEGHAAKQHADDQMMNAASSKGHRAVLSRRVTEANASSERVVLLPQLDPHLTRHQRRFVAVRPAAMAQYIADRRMAFLEAIHSLDVASGVCSGLTPCAEAAITARVVSCFTHNARPPQPLYNSRADASQWHALSNTFGSCFGRHSDVGKWLVPLAPLVAEPNRPYTLPPECAELLDAPAQLLRISEAGFRALYGAELVDEWARGSGRAEAVAWYRHELSLIQSAARARVVVSK